MLKTARNICLLAAFAAASLASAALPPVPAPPENPITENKRVLGKILFFDEQLSTDNTMACATCHINSRGGTDPRRQPNPGFDGIFNSPTTPSPDDVLASPGVVRSDAFNSYLRDSVFNLTPQVTGRTANAHINAAYAPQLFWDGRARSQFIEPQTLRVSIAAGGALESQVVAPPVNSVEMAHDSMDWNVACFKLAHAKPLVVATNLPADVVAALADSPNYPTLFQRAFGDPAVTAERVAFAIATYERTLIADQSRWDISQATPGSPNGLTAQQQRGANAFVGSGCNACHTAPLFTDNAFHAIGVRPPLEDRGLATITGDNNDRGKFKTPSLRNVGLKTSFFHNGQRTTLQQVIGFYAGGIGGPNGQFPDNRDPLMNNVNIPPPPPPGGGPGAGADIQEFIQNGLTDPRVAAQTFPFDRATLYSESTVNRPINLGGGVAGTGGIVPQILAIDPPFIGNTAFRLGLDRARAGSLARLIVSTAAPEAGKLTGERIFGMQITSGVGAGNGFATQVWPLKAPAAQQGQTLYAQWVIADPNAPDGLAYSTVAQFRFFCGSAGCAPSCMADYTNDYIVSVDDLFGYLNAWFTGDIRADIDGAGAITIDDLFRYFNEYFVGC